MQQLINTLAHWIIVILIAVPVATLIWAVIMWYRAKATTIQKDYFNRGLLLLFGVPVALAILTWVIELYAVVVYWAWNLVWPF